jgi:uncharacterized sulfatase
MPDEELYDLRADPWEIHNSAASDKPEDRAALKRLRDVLEKWIIDTDDQGRHPEPASASAGGLGSNSAREKAEAKAKRKARRAP